MSNLDIERNERPIECCRDPENMELERLPDHEGNERHVETCKCGRKHRVMVVPKIEFGVQGFAAGVSAGPMDICETSTIDVSAQ
jgi:hypothetical protein